MTGNVQNVSSAVAEYGWRRYPLYVLIMLCLANTLGVADRNIMSILLEPIKHDLQASDAGMSLLTGASFVLFYCLFGIPIALGADRGNRRDILAAGVALWSVMTALCGVAVNFSQMALARAGVGVGEATGTPTSISLIADYYVRTARPKAIAILNLSQGLGAILVLPPIGWIADHYGWRAAFLALGIPGVILALILKLTVREPLRGGLDEDHGLGSGLTTLRGAVKAMTSSRPFMLIFIGTAITGLGSGSLSAWGPAMMMRAFHVTTTQIATIQAPVAAVGAILGTLCGGYVTPWLAKRRKSERWIVLAPAVVSLLTVPAGLLYVLTPTFGWTVLGGFLGFFTVGFRLAPYLALSLDLVPANCRGMAAAATLIATSVVGQAGGPLVVGVISDALAPTLGSVEALRVGLAFAPFMLAVGVAPFFFALRDFDSHGLKRNGQALSA